MSIKQSKKTPLQKPLVRFYVAEDLRPEVGGKISVVGLFPDNVVVLPLPTSVPEPTAAAPILFKSLAFLFNISKLSQAADVSIDFESSGIRRPFIANQRHPNPGIGKSINLAGVMQPCAVESFGLKKLIVTVGEEVQTFEFEIRRDVPLDTDTFTEPKMEIPKAKKVRLQTSKNPPKKLTHTKVV